MWYIFCVCTRCCMLRVCLPHHHRLSNEEACYVMQSLVRLSHHNRKITWPRYGGIDVKCLFQGHNDALPSSETEPRADKLAIAQLALLSTITFPIKCLSQKSAQCGHRTSNFTITIRRSIIFIYTAVQPEYIQSLCPTCLHIRNGMDRHYTH